MKHWKAVSIAILALAVLGTAFAMWQLRTLNKAHSTFENYYSFRGCTKLLERTDTYGTCVTNSGKTIKIVEYQGRWFLDGDLPCKTGICW
jgi:hypothetical protein